MRGQGVEPTALFVTNPDATDDKILEDISTHLVIIGPEFTVSCRFCPFDRRRLAD